MSKDIRVISFINIRLLNTSFLSDKGLNEEQLTILLVLQHRTHYLKDLEKTTVSNLCKILGKSKQLILGNMKILKDKRLVRVTKFKANCYYITPEGYNLLNSFILRLNNLTIDKV